MASLRTGMPARSLSVAAVSRPRVACPTTAAPPAQLSPPVAKTNVISRRGQALTVYAAAQADAPETSAIPAEELIEKTRKFVESGFKGAVDKDLYSEDLIFRGPEVGPLMRDEYLGAISSFSIPDAFPDIQVKAFGFSIDPTDPYRVWYMTQTTGTHTGDFNFAGTVIPATGGKIQNGTEAGSVIWTPEGKIKYISVGYCCDRINSNTPNGTMKVAVVGMLRACGKQGIWEFISNPVVQWGTKVVNKLQGKPDPRTPFEDLPEWWKKIPDADLRGAEGYQK